MKRLVIFTILAITLFACSGDEEESYEYYSIDCEAYSVNSNNPIKDIEFFAYQIQDISDDDRLQEIIDSKYDLVVIEPTRTDVTGDSDFDTKGAVAAIKASKAHNGVDGKMVIAYIDIGEVEDWRWYWSWSKIEWEAGNPKPADWPDYIVKPDPDGWTGNYPVAYWDEDWKDIVIYGENTTNPYGEYVSVLDEVLLDGFDGVYLDWVEGYEDVDIDALAKSEGLNAANEMMLFIQEIQEYGKSRNPDFIVIQQNAAELISKAPGIVNYIDGITQEAIWYDGFGGFDDWDDDEGYDVLNDLDLSNYYLENLENYMEAGIPVWCVEYALENAEEAYALAYEHCMIPHVTRRSLAKLSTTPPPGY
jgi:cysteinyl-tRNA synthetase